MASTYEMLKAAERVELLSAKLYKALAKRFRGGPDARALFADLEGEEFQHAARLRLLAARYRHDPKLLARVTGELPALELLGQECEAVIAAIEAGSFAADAAAARANLAALEARFATAHAEVLAATGHPEVRRLFAQLARQDGGHVRLLEQAGAERARDDEEARRDAAREERRRLRGRR